MNSNGLIKRIIVSSLIVLSIAVFAFADTIKLKDGSTVKGRIVGFRGGKFTIVVGEGPRRREFTFEADEVESIEFDRTSVEPVSEPVTRPVSNSSRPVAEEPVIQEEQPKPVPVKTEPRPSTTGEAAKPVTLNVTVRADDTANGWTNSGWVVRKGQKIKIVGEGEVSLGKGNKVGPSGSYTLEDETKLLKSVPTGALIAVIGDDNNDFIYIGSDREFVATRDGTLFLGLNEGNLKDNSGTFKVTIEISTDR